MPSFQAPDSCDDQALEAVSNQAYETERLEYTELESDSGEYQSVIYSIFSFLLANTIITPA